MNEKETVSFLQKNGLMNPYRIRDLISQAIEDYHLNLRGFKVLTETASKNYAVTPIIAAMAGAEVFALTTDSIYGKKEAIDRLTCVFADFCQLSKSIKVIYHKDPTIIYKADIATNLGFVRPIDREFIASMHSQAVIPYMCEAWEYRPGDLDLRYCSQKGIPVVATNEDHSTLKVFDFVGPLCAKMIFQLGIEVYQSRIVVLSPDKFGIAISKYLQQMGADVKLLKDLRKAFNRAFLSGIDALIIADYSSRECYIGPSGHMTFSELLDSSKGLSIIRFAGNLDIRECVKRGIPYYPMNHSKPYRMGMTFADLGPKPVINLHCAGLKAGEAVSRLRKKGLSLGQIKKRFTKNDLFYLMNDFLE